MDWRDFAACRDEDRELFFPTGHGAPARLQTAQAKAVCRRCPALEDCRAWALAAGSDAAYGVFGGLDEDERRLLVRRRAERTDAMLDEQCRRATGSSRPELARRLLDEGMAATEVAARLSVDPSVVRRWACHAA